MNLKDWGKLTPKEQEDILADKTWELQHPDKCSSSMLELRNAMKREIEDEGAASRKYMEMSTKLMALGKRSKSDILALMSGQEQMHKIILTSLVEVITKECGE